MIRIVTPAVAAALAVAACGEDDAVTKRDPAAPKPEARQKRTHAKAPKPEQPPPATIERRHTQPAKRRPRALTRERIARAEQDKGTPRVLSARELNALELEQERGTGKTQTLSKRQLRAIEVEQQRR